MATIKLLTYDVYRQGMTLFKTYADQTYQDIEHLPLYYLAKLPDSQVPAGYDSAYNLLQHINGQIDKKMGDTIGIMGSKGGGVIQSYIVSGATVYSSGWLTDVPGSPAFVPSETFLYLILSEGNQHNCFYRYDEDLERYILVAEGGGDGAIFCYTVAGKTALNSDWLTDEAGGSPITPKEGILYLVLTPGDYYNNLYRYNATTGKYVLTNSSDLVFAYTVSGKTALAADWLSLTPSGSPLVPVDKKFYIVLSDGDYKNFIFRFDSGLNAYVMLSGGGAGGAIFTYIVAGATALSPGWLSESVGGTALTPKEGLLYLVLTAGAYYSGVYRYDETNRTYVLVGNARVVEISKADYLNLPEAKQKDGTIYFIVNDASSAPTKDDYVPSRYTAPEASAAGTVILWKGAVGGDFVISPAFYEYKNSHWVKTNLGIDGQTIQVDTIPDASATFNGCVFQYIGNTTVDYQHNFFYECVHTNDTYHWINVKVQPGEVIQVDPLPTPSAELVGTIYQFVGTTTANHTHGYFYECKSNGATPAVYSWVNIPVQDGDEFQVTTMPSPSAELSGRCVQFLGTTTASYTHGYFYECINSGGSYSWVNVKTQPGDEFQLTTMPTASAAYANNKAYQYIGVTTVNYINGYFYRCVSDGESTPTYSWEVVGFDFNALDNRPKTKVTTIDDIIASNPLPDPSEEDPSSPGGHEIRSGETVFETRTGLDFAGFDVEDAPDKDETVVFPHELTSDELEAICKDLPAPGVPSVNYSTEEQVVGKWIDGTSVYMKVITGLNLMLSWNNQYQTRIVTDPLISDVATLIDAKGLTNNCYLPLAIDLTTDGYTKWELMSFAVGVSAINTLILQYTKHLGEALIPVCSAAVANITYSSTYRTSDYDGWYAFNGDATNDWSTATNDSASWIQWTFDAPVYITEITLVNTRTHSDKDTITSITVTGLNAENEWDTLLVRNPNAQSFSYIRSGIDVTKLHTAYSAVKIQQGRTETAGHLAYLGICQVYGYPVE